MDKTVGVCDLVTGDVLQRLRGHTNAVQDICFDATKILTGSADCTLRYRLIYSVLICLSTMIIHPYQPCPCMVR